MHARHPALCLLFGLTWVGAPLALADDFVVRETASFDVDRQVGLGLLRDDQVTTGGSIETLPSSGLPDATDLDAYSLDEDGTAYFSTNLTVELDGGLVAGPGDVVQIDPDGTLSIAIDRAALGISPGAAIDAVTVTSDGDFPLAVSFDVTVELPADGGSLVVDDEDLARFDGTVFELWLDGSLEGVSPSSDLDAAHFDGVAQQLWVSFDTSGAIDGIVYDDEDLLGFDLSTDTWSLLRDASDVAPDLAGGGDLDAYALLRAEALFADGFESGDTAGWTSFAP